MAKWNSIDYINSLPEDDSGISLDYNYSSSTLNESVPSYFSQTPITSPVSFHAPLTTTIVRERSVPASTVRLTSDGISQRIRPATMRNSENGDYIICRTNHGTFIAHRTPIVPQWVRELVEDIEFQQR